MMNFLLLLVIALAGLDISFGIYCGSPIDTDPAGGELKSSNYPANYNSWENKCWRFPGPTTLAFCDFDLEPEDTCYYDNVNVNGGKLCGSHAGETHTVTGPLDVTFWSNSWGQYPGFWIKYCPVGSTNCDLSCPPICGGLTCKNAGALDKVTCKCNCYKSMLKNYQLYTGEDCSILTCPAENLDETFCWTSAQSICGTGDHTWDQSCPYLCGTCSPDANECDNPDTCAEGATCTNTYGGFTCTPWCETSGCTTNATCKKRINKWECVCDPGWVGDGTTLCKEETM